MPKFSCEFIAHGPRQVISLSIRAYVHKYIERFVYTDKIVEPNTPIAYFELNPIDAWKNIQLVDQTHTIPANTKALWDQSFVWAKITTKTFTSKYKNIAITNQAIIDDYGKEQPLFYKHKLKSGTIEANLYFIEKGNKTDISKGYRIVLSENAIYTNYRNFYDLDTGSYRLFFVTSVQQDSQGNTSSTHELLSPVPAIHLTTWEDVNLETGEVTTLSYSIEESPSGYTFSVNGMQSTLAPQACSDDRSVLEDEAGLAYLYVKPTEESFIQPLLPARRTPEDPWNIRLTNGRFTEVLNGRLRKYSIPEFDRQPFSPSKPYIYAPNMKMTWVNRNMLKATRDAIAIYPSKYMYITVLAYDPDGILARAYTNNLSLINTKYTDTDIVYETDKIMSWDNSGGFLAFGVSLDPNYTYYASLFYEAKEYDYTFANLNPIQNHNARVWMWVFYMIPDIHTMDRAIHSLGVDEDGYIVYCSQSKGYAYPNLQLLNSDKGFNSNTVIGMKYSSMTDPNNFKSLYCVPYQNDNQYYVLAEAVVMDTEDTSDARIFDVRRIGAIIKPSYFEEAIRANPRILQSRLGYGPQGQRVPLDGVVIIEVPVTLLSEYGGDFKDEELRINLTKDLPSGVHGVIKYTFASPKLDCVSEDEGTVDITFTWEGPDLTYKLYRKVNPVGDWSLLTSFSTGTTPTSLQYKDINLSSDKVYYYAVRVVEDSIELPFGNTIGVMVR